jgi:hypothetical protein
MSKPDVDKWDDVPLGQIPFETLLKIVKDKKEQKKEPSSRILLKEEEDDDDVPLIRKVPPKKGSKKTNTTQHKHQVGDPVYVLSVWGIGGTRQQHITEIHSPQRLTITDDRGYKSTWKARKDKEGRLVWSDEGELKLKTSPRYRHQLVFGILTNEMQQHEAARDANHLAHY